MKIRDIINMLNGDAIVLCHDLDYEIDTACSADLMSDVMAFCKGNSILITGLVNLQVIRTSELMDMKVVIFARGKKPNDAMINLAKELNITVILTKELMYEACGKLYESGLNGLSGGNE